MPVTILRPFITGLLLVWLLNTGGLLTVKGGEDDEVIEIEPPAFVVSTVPGP